MELKTDSREGRVIWAWFPVTFAAALFCCVLWGSASPAIKIAYELFRIGPSDTASRIMLAGARFNHLQDQRQDQKDIRELYLYLL